MTPRWIPCVVCGYVESAHAPGCVSGCTRAPSACPVCPGTCWGAHVFEAPTTDYRIGAFQGPYRFLSNFEAPAPTEYEGLVYPSSEAAFQAAKFDHQWRGIFQGLSASEAKRKGRMPGCRKDWDTVRDRVMLAVVWSKFTRNESLRRALLSTEHAELVEGNTWGDHYWGVAGGFGENRLGQILMIVRAGIRRLTPEAPLGA